MKVMTVIKSQPSGDCNVENEQHQHSVLPRHMRCDGCWKGSCSCQPLKRTVCLKALPPGPNYTSEHRSLMCSDLLR